MLKNTLLKPKLAVLGSLIAFTSLNTSVFAQSAATFPSCLQSLQSDANRAGVSTATYTRLTNNLQADLSILEKLNYQPEFRQPIWDYMSALVDEQRVNEGKSKLAQHHDILKRVEQVYGVDPATVVAVWGVESNFGQNFGSYPILTALGTLSCYGRRQAFFRKEFYAALKIIQAGDIPVEEFRSSWAGAFGHTQFMPTTFERLAVDFDGDGRRDLMNNTADALGSTANYLKRNGWQTGQTWGFEVKLPAGFNTAGEGRRTKRSIQTWQQRGIRGILGQSLSDLAPLSQQAGLLTPAGPQGPAFLVFKNFDVIYSYNAAESYALAIAHLSDRLRDGPAFFTPWPTDDLGLSRNDRVALQKLLLARGHDIGEADGLIGPKSREAIKAEEARFGMPVSGRAGQKILKKLQGN
ncbi:MAG: lytic murein transglycosylase [Alcaligenaceae bacterium]|nr:lytic murein transglycosylase [Alcaligenaceae bacterium]